MHKALIEQAWVDLDAAPRDTARITHLADPDEPQWTGIVELGPSGFFTFEAGYRHDLYLLRGKVNIADLTLDTEDFLVLRRPAVMQAGNEGARLLVYRQPGDASPQEPVSVAKKRTWRSGVNPGMEVVTLAAGTHHVSLVAWQPGAQTRLHAHPRGEEMFVLKGELSDADERHPAGTWLRLHPGSTHAPFARVTATILLRHGHLVAA